jgi:uncharacterized protein (TIGR00255 family)
MKSMTGYGRGECRKAGMRVSVECSSVNRRQNETAVDLPRALEVLEAQVRDEINQRIARGRISVRIAIHAASARGSAQVRVNQPLAAACARELEQLARRLHIQPTVTLDQLLRIPGVLQAEDAPDAESFWPAVQSALRAALEALIRMREREGAHLAKDLQARLGNMRRAVNAIQRRAPTVTRRYREQLLKRLRQAGYPWSQSDEERLLKEILIFADRSDITEELVRLRSHLEQTSQALGSTEPVGRKLDFLAQELNREINTIGSKASDADIAQRVIALKTELERFREQAQNVE